MSRATSIAGVRPLGWLARLRAHCSCLAWACPAQLLGGWLGRCGAGANHGAGQGARDEHARQRSGACASAPRGQAEGCADGYLLRALRWRQAQDAREKVEAFLIWKHKHSMRARFFSGKSCKARFWKDFGELPKPQKPK